MQAKSRFWSGWFRVGKKPVLEQAHNRIGCSRLQNRFSIKTGFASSIEATKLDLSQNGSIQNLHSIKCQDWLCILYIYILYIYNLYIYIFSLYILYIYKEYLYIYIQSLLVFDTMQVVYWHVLGQIQFVTSIEDAKPVLILNRFCTLPHPNWLWACSKTGFVPILDQPFQNQLCACSKPALCRP